MARNEAESGMVKLDGKEIPIHELTSFTPTLERIERALEALPLREFLTTKELSRRTGIPIRSISSQTPNLVNKGYARQIGRVYVFSTQKMIKELDAHLTK